MRMKYLISSVMGVSCGDQAKASSLRPVPLLLLPMLDPLLHPDDRLHLLLLALQSCLKFHQPCITVKSTMNMTLKTQAITCNGTRTTSHLGVPTSKANFKMSHTPTLHKNEFLRIKMRLMIRLKKRTISCQKYTQSLYHKSFLLSH